MRKSGAIEIPFGWLFAIIVGAFILFLAIYGVTKLIGTEEEIQSAKIGTEIMVLLNPLETSFESGQSTSMTLPVETRIYTRCSEEGNFGRQLISISQKSFNKWAETDLEVGSSNKYIFTENPVEGKTFYLFSKPFEFPFKVADLIYLISSSEKYCFKDAPKDIEEELKNLDQGNFIFENCEGKFVGVCFSGGSCDIKINRDAGYLEKRGKNFYFDGDALMYAGIFSDKENYECEVKRLMQRAEQLALLYDDKADFISQTADCNSNLDLQELASSARSLSSSANLNSVKNIAEEIEDKNSKARCKLW